MLRDHTLVLDGHLPTGEGNHPCSGSDVAGVERRTEQGLHGADSNDWRKHEAPANRGLGPGLLDRLVQSAKRACAQDSAPSRK